VLVCSIHDGRLINPWEGNGTLPPLPAGRPKSENLTAPTFPPRARLPADLQIRAEALRVELRRGDITPKVKGCHLALLLFGVGRGDTDSNADADADGGGSCRGMPSTCASCWSRSLMGAVSG
jgi:hypothetical protein